MQKRASFNPYEIVPDSIPFSKDSAVYVDKAPVELPISPISSLHYHNRLEIGLCHSGSGIFYSNLKSECIKRGDIVFFLPGIAHFSQNLNPYESCNCRFAFIDIVPILFSLFKEKSTGINLISDAQTYDIPPIIRKNEYPEAHLILNQLLTDAFENAQNLDFLVSLHLAEFLLKTPKFFKKSNQHSQCQPEKNGDIIYMVEAFISSHYNEPINIPQLCEICHLSASQLRRKYKDKFGVTPISYLHSLRCNIASQLLIHTTLSINEIAQKIGYPDFSVFYKHFYSFFNCAPSHYRKKYEKI